jgi:uncharacterized protein with PIN domain
MVRQNCSDCGGAVRWLDGPELAKAVPADVWKLLGSVSSGWVCDACGQGGYFGPAGVR